MRKIYDCFTFFNELDLLDIRLNEIYDKVDYFVISESNKTHYNRFVTFGSGAEFGLDRNIENFTETQLLECFPKESYGFSKNIIARTILNTENFYNLRLFSCFHGTESDKRLLKKFIKSVEADEQFFIDKDRYVDFMGLHDVALVVNAVLSNEITERDLNVVYANKFKVSYLLIRYCELHSINTNYVQVSGNSDINYTGDGSRIDLYGIKLTGLDESLKNYT